MRSLILAVFLSFLNTPAGYGNQTKWPHWLNKDDIVTLAIESTVALFPGIAINAIQIETVNTWAKSGPAVLGFIGKDGIFKPKIEVEYSEHGQAAIRFNEFVVTDNLQLKTAKGMKTIGTVDALESIREILLRNSRRMP